MAANIILFDQTKSPMREVVEAVKAIRDNLAKLGNARAVMTQYRDGDGSQAAHWDLLALAGGFSAGDYATPDAAAKAMFDEIDSLYAKLTTDGSVTQVNAAILQAPAKLGV